MSTFIRRVKGSDDFLLKLFNNTIKCKLFDILMPIITYLGSAVFTTLYCFVLLFIPSEFGYYFAIKCSLTLLSSTLVTQIIKHTVNRIRPYIKIDNLNVKMIGIDNYSFPSGHTTAAFSTAVITGLFFPNFFSGAIILASFVGVSRMYLGVHYPTDVLIGMIIGTGSAYVIYYI